MMGMPKDTPVKEQFHELNRRWDKFLVHGLDSFCHRADVKFFHHINNTLNQCHILVLVRSFIKEQAVNFQYINTQGSLPRWT